jgi:FKBP-type peptidyl-prolyl cis-trans isomerase FkpA
VGYGFWRASRKPQAKIVVPAPTSSTAGTLQAASNSGTSLSVGNNTGLGGGTEISSSANQQTGTSSSSKPATSSTAGPESFGQYEQYNTTLYSDLQVGTGAELVAGKKAAVIYKVWLTNGTLVDESKLDKPGGKLQPFVFTLGDHSVIPGWEQGVFGMKVNGVRRMIIPAALAYGAQGQSGVPPNSMLIIDVQLLQVQ